MDVRYPECGTFIPSYLTEKDRSTTKAEQIGRQPHGIVSAT
jgi:hypothetical protein